MYTHLYPVFVVHYGVAQDGDWVIACDTETGARREYDKLIARGEPVSLVQLGYPRDPMAQPIVICEL